MRTTLALTLVALLSAGCVVSMQPLFDDVELVADTRLAGTWHDEDGADRLVIWSVPRDGVPLYRIEYASDGRTGTFEGRLGRLGSHLILDVLPTPPPEAVAKPYTALYVPAYLAVVLDFEGDVIITHLLDPDSLAAALSASTSRISAHAPASGDQLVLHGAPADARAELLPLLGRAGILGSRTVWRRAVR